MAIPFIRDNGRNGDILDRFSSEDLVWSDEFGGTNLNDDKWKILRMREHSAGDKNGEYQSMSSLNHQKSNFGQDELGVEGEDKYPNGKRHDLWYDEYHEQTIGVADGQLTLKGFVSGDDDPTTDGTYLDERTSHPLPATADWTKKVYAPWIDTASVRPAANPETGEMDFREVDPQGPSHYWRYGYFEMDIDLSQVNIPGFRVSAWLMPIVDPEKGPAVWPGNGTAYNCNHEDGQEMDLFEYENSNFGYGDDRLLMKQIDDAAGGKHKDHVIAPDWGYEEDGESKIIDPKVGVHTLGLWWTPGFVAWYVDGVEVNRDPNPPKIAQYFSITREGNSCVGTDQDNAPDADPPKRIKSNGYLWNRNMGCFLDHVVNDRAVISYVRVWQDPTLNGTGTNYNFKSPFNTTNAIDPDTPMDNLPRYAGAPAHGNQEGTPVRFDPLGGPSSYLPSEYGRVGHFMTGIGKKPNEYTDDGYQGTTPGPVPTPPPPPGPGTDDNFADSPDTTHEPDFNLTVSGNTLIWQPYRDISEYNIKVGANDYVGKVDSLSDNFDGTDYTFEVTESGKYFITAIDEPNGFNSLIETVIVPQFLMRRFRMKALYGNQNRFHIQHPLHQLQTNDLFLKRPLRAETFSEFRQPGTSRQNPVPDDSMLLEQRLSMLELEMAELKGLVVELNVELRRHRSKSRH